MSFVHSNRILGLRKLRIFLHFRIYKGSRVHGFGLWLLSFWMDFFSNRVLGCGETFMGIAALVWNSVEKVAILISGIQTWISYRLGQCHGSIHVLLFSRQSCISWWPDGLFGTLVTLYGSSRLGTTGNQHAPQWSMSQCAQECYTWIVSSRHFKASLYIRFLKHIAFIFMYNDLTLYSWVWMPLVF